MRAYENESLINDPLHGYIGFTSPRGLPPGEISEREIVDHPWIQRLRQIHQLQTAWWVFPSAEHSRFQHVVGVMHVASRAAESLYPSLSAICPDVPSQGYVETLLRMAGLLHDVGHGPYGHFFDQHFLARFGETHETVGAAIICGPLGDLLRGVRRNPNTALEPGETLDPAQIAVLVARPRPDDTQQLPPWLAMLRSLFSGLYTVDNMDFVLRDAYMSGFSTRVFDIDRLLHYSFFSERGLTIHDRGTAALVRFLVARAELFRTLYFHRTVRAIDLTLEELFADSRDLLFDGNPRERLDAYLHFTEWSLLIGVAQWNQRAEPEYRALGPRWQQFLRREVRWKMACERTVFFPPHQSEAASIFSQREFFETALRERLPRHLRGLALRLDLPRHVHRPGTPGAAPGQNFLFDAARQVARPLTDSELVRQIPLGYRICRIYAETHEHDAVLARALEELVGPGVADDATNM